MPPNKLTSTKRFAVRISLVTGSTLAVIIGAQSLASLDDKVASISEPDAVAPVVIDPSLLQPGTSPVDNRLLQPPSDQAATDTVHVPPVITIMRHPGQSSGTTSVQGSASIKPPDPIQLTAPQPIVVQAPGQVIQVAGPAPAVSEPSVPTTRSSR